MGLVQDLYATNADVCRENCCLDTNCAVWQFGPPVGGGCCGDGCWRGQASGFEATTYPGEGAQKLSMPASTAQYYLEQANVTATQPAARGSSGELTNDAIALWMACLIFVGVIFAMGAWWYMGRRLSVRAVVPTTAADFAQLAQKQQQEMDRRLGDLARAANEARDADDPLRSRFWRRQRRPSAGRCQVDGLATVAQATGSKRADRYDDTDVDGGRPAEASVDWDVEDVDLDDLAYIEPEYEPQSIFKTTSEWGREMEMDDLSDGAGSDEREERTPRPSRRAAYEFHSPANGHDDDHDDGGELDDLEELPDSPDPVEHASLSEEMVMDLSDVHLLQGAGGVWATMRDSPVEEGALFEDDGMPPANMEGAEVDEEVLSEDKPFDEDLGVEEVVDDAEVMDDAEPPEPARPSPP